MTLPAIVDAVVYGADKFVAMKVAKALGLPMFENYAALGVTKDDILVGGVVYHNYRVHDIEISSAFERRDWANRTILRHLFTFPFVTIGCKRMTAVTAESNAKARNALEIMGFKVEGRHPLGFEGREAAISYGLLASDCKWIRRPKEARAAVAAG